MKELFCFSSWGFSGAETVVTGRGCPGLVLWEDGTEATALVEELSMTFYGLKLATEPFEATHWLLRVYALACELCETMARPESLMQSTFYSVFVERGSESIYFSEDPMCGPFVEIRDMLSTRYFATNDRPDDAFFVRLDELRRDPLAKIIKEPRMIALQFDDLCEELTRLPTLRGWRRMHIQLLRIYARTRWLVRALTGSTFHVDGFPFAFITAENHIDFRQHDRHEEGLVEATKLQLPDRPVFC